MIKEFASSCISTTTEGTKWIAEISYHFINPFEYIKGAYRLTIHFPTIIIDIISIESNIKNGNYTEAGKNIGEIMRIWVWGETEIQK